MFEVLDVMRIRKKDPQRKAAPVAKKSGSPQERRKRVSVQKISPGFPAGLSSSSM